MMKFIIAVLLLSIQCFNMMAQEKKPEIKVGEYRSIYSEVLKEKRDLWIYTPSFDTNYFSKPAYPVLYVLDGDGYFLSLAGMMHQLSIVNGNTALPKMIMVAISTGANRTRDLSPSRSSTDKNSGGGENFLKFMGKELIPFIDSNYATAPFRTIVGHSLGGLIVIHALLNHTNLFNNYLANDPSIWWNNDHILTNIDSVLKHKNFAGRSLHIGIANTMMNATMDTISVKKDTSETTHHIRSIFKLTEILRNQSKSDLKWEYKYYPDDDHASVPFVSNYDGLRYFFRTNKFPSNMLFEARVSPDSMRTLIHSYFKKLTQERGYEVKPDEFLINNLGYIFLQLKDYERSKMYFQMNIDFFPKNFNPYDSMADYYWARNEQQKGIELLKKALSMKKTTEMETKLKDWMEKSNKIE